ncbi:DUF1566 domain-containing protein [uncultured Variovorax sp.]|uniref:DUF1566 domain-containing protein n=1 Tax=uncultured Variovorax sp. TaxID=114708 RepID=UPI0026215F1F|nr:DUF1566 domain-containing protein [uncultured Variovorax sp.]
MTTTLEAVKARQAELDKMIKELQLRAEAIVTTITTPETHIELRAGEHYAGAVLDETGRIEHHLVLMAARPSERLNWDDAMKWATEVGGVLPDRQEQALLFANCKPHLEAAWHWSSQAHEEDASYAWYCDFSTATSSAPTRATRVAPLPSAGFEPFGPSILLS